MDLRRLWALHEVDTELTEIKKRAAGLDVGQAEAAAIQTLEAANAESSKLYHDLLTAQTDVNLQRKGTEDKIKQIETKLYSGTITNAREVANYNKELEGLQKQLEGLVSRLEDIAKAIPPLKIKEDKLDAARSELKKKQAAKLAAARELKPKMEAAYKAAVAKRAEALKAVPPPLVARYDAIRARQNGIGMGQVTKTQNCSSCGTNLPERVVDAVKSDRIVTCESCHRILYYTEGVL
jgi:predicted  nucleic acid-binding Zn-ribbon protein